MAGSDDLGSNLNKQTKSSGSCPPGDLNLEEREKISSRASLSEAAGSNEKGLEQTRAIKEAAKLLQKAAIEYCSEKLLANAAQCFERAAELENFDGLCYKSFTLLSGAFICYKENFQYDKAEQCILKLINMASEWVSLSVVADYNCELADIYVLKRLYSEANKHYEIAYNLYSVDHFSHKDCNYMLEKQANLSILQNDFGAAAKYFILIFESHHSDVLLQSRSVEYFIKSCLSFLIDNLKKSSDYYKEKQQNTKFSQSAKGDLAIVLGIIDAVKEKNYESFKSLIEDQEYYTFHLDNTLNDILFAIEKKYFLEEDGSEKKYGKLPAADDDIDLEKLLDDENIERADANKSLNISKDNSPSAPALPNSTNNALKEKGDDHDKDINLK